MALALGHAAGFAAVFGNERFSDCDIVFSISCKPKKQRLDNGAAVCCVASERNSEAAPLPAHQLVLAFASAPLAAQLERWKSNTSQQLSNGTTTQHARPQLKMHIDNADEVEGARAAIKFVYTGSVSVCSVREALLTRLYGSSLELAHCAAACDSWVLAELKDRNPPSVLELYACQELWPEDSSFEMVLMAAKPLLVAHFGDALRVMSNKSLRSSMLELPVEALEVLLASNDFGTDSESSVLMLLATWMEANYGDTDDEIRLQLRRAVRLTHLGLPYRCSVLPILAHEYQSHPKSRAGWFPVGVVEAIVMQQYVTAAKEGQQELYDAVQEDEDLAPNLTALTCRPRRQCIPAEGLVLNWTLQADDLLKQISRIAAGDSVGELSVNFEGGLNVFAFEGLYWGLVIDLDQGGRGAGCYARAYASSEFDVEGSRLMEVPIVAELSARLVIRRWADEGRKPRDIVRDLSGWYCTGEDERHAVKPLPLRGARSSGFGGEDQPLAPWVDYLRDDQISGTLTLQRPAMSAGTSGTQKP